MKKIINYILGIVSLAVMTACAPEELSTTFEGGERTLTLSFTLDDSSSRVVDEAIVNNSEVKITRADIFVYKKNYGETYTFSFKVNNVEPSSMVENNEDEHRHFECTAQFSIPSGITFNGETYKIYVVANSDVASDGLSAKLDELQSPDVEKLKNLSFTSALQSLINEDTRFIMDGEADVTIDNKNVVSNEIVLTRAAAKIVLDLSIYQNITTSDKIEYQPVLYSGEGENQVSNIRVSFHNGVNTYNYASPTFFNTDKWIGEPEDATKTTSSVYLIAIDPFYTYPIEWEPSSESEPYLMLEIPWKKTTDGDSKDYDIYYYRIPVNRKFMNADNTKLALKRNNMYEIAIKVGVLGSTDPSIPITIDNAEYNIMDWGVLPIDAAIRDYKYLVVDQLNINMDNIETSNNIGYKSSSPITVKVTSIKFWDYYYSENTPSKEITINGANYWTYSEITENEKTSSMTSTTKYTDNNSRYNNDKYTTSWNEKTFFLNHPFKKTANNVIDTYVKYEITLLVSNDDGLTETVTINQYPPIYIEGEVNPDVKNKANDGTYPNRGYVIINNRNDANGSSWEDANSLSGDNKNTSMYVIHVTTLINSAYSSFLVGESREKKDSETFTGAKYDDLGNALEHLYYSNNNNLSIAPTFRIASSFGVVYSISFDDAKRRCAGYQEAGYKAGRWRIPTESEAKFICGLSNDGKIPLLFTTNYEYWVSTGKTIENAEINSTIPTSAYVRCVYDEWYWGNDRLTDYTQFVWGNNKVY